MADSSRINLLKTLITTADAVQKLDDRFGPLFRRLNAILRLLQSTKKYVSIPADFDSLLLSVRVVLERALKLEPTEMLMSEINRINSRLLEHLISLTNDPKEKIELYAAVLHDDRIASKQQYEIEIRERESLRKIVVHAKLTDLSQANKKAIQTLNDQFKTVIKPYVDKCISVHGTLQVRGLEQISQDFGRRFYGQKSWTNMNKKVPLLAAIDIPLESAHVCLRADKSTAFERQQARDAMTSGSNQIKGYDEVLWTKLAVAPYMPSLIERDRFVSEHNQNQSLSPASVLQEHRWIVVLGDPGSGKTTLVRWLALKFAQAFKREEPVIKLSTITEDVAKLETTTVGPTRIPILIRVGEYGDALRENDKLSLFDYIGQHQWIGQTFINIASTTERNRAIAQLSNALKNYVQAGQALIILDGLDEIPASEQRYHIVDRIESFVDQFVQTPSCVSAFDQEKFGFSWNQLSKLDLPSNSGGNQIIVTSRIVGYHAGPLKGNFTHFTLEPLKLTGIDSFVSHWFNAVHRQLLRVLRITPQTEEVIKSKVNKHTSELKKEINNPNNKGLRELASNPLLLSVICMMSFQSHEQTTNALPVHRVCLYQDAVEWMLNSWRSRDPSINMNVVKTVLCKIAVYIHKNSASGLIEQSTMTRLCSESLTTSTGETNEDRVSNFVRIIREEVGVLAARGEFAYGFLHLTFQEYFVALDMLDANINMSTEKAESIANRFFESMNDPRYREPLLLALGLVSWKCSVGEYDSFCCELLSKRAFQSKIFSSLVPLGAMLFVSSIGDLVKLPSNTLVFDAFDRILDASAEHQWHLFFPNLEALIASGLSKLPSAISKEWALRFLTSPSISIAQICGFCHVLVACGNQNTPPSLSSVLWLDQQIVNLLWTLLSFEHEDEELIIDFTLVQLAQAYPAFFDSQRLRFRAFAISRNIVISPSLLPLVIALYGGLRRNEKHEVHFSATYIHRDSSLTPLLIRYFHPNNQSSKEMKFSCIIDYCERIVKSLTLTDHSLRAVDSFLALFCLKSMNDSTLCQSYMEYKAFQLAQKRIKRVFKNLSEFYFSTEDCISSASTDGTEIVDKLMQINNFDNDDSEIDSSQVNDFLANISAIASAVRRLGSGKNSFLFPGQSTKDNVGIGLPPLFFETERIQRVLLADNNIIGLPNFLRKFWSLRLGPGSYDDVSHQRCIEIDCQSSAMALCHDKTALFALAFLPPLIEKIYIRLLTRGECILDDDRVCGSKEFIQEAQLLTECVLQLHDGFCCKYTMTYLLILLHSLLKKHRLENFAASFIWTLKSRMLKKHYYSMINVTLEEDISVGQAINEEEIDDIYGEKELDKEEEIDDIYGEKELDKEEEIDDIYGKKEFDKEEIDDIYGEKELDNEEKIISDAAALEVDRLQKILAETHRNDQLLYSSTVSLIHICWFMFDASFKWELLKAAIQAAHFISSPVFKIHALTVIISHPCVIPLMSIALLEGRTLRDDFLNSLKELPLILSPMIASLLVVRCLPHVDNDAMRAQFAGLLLKKFHDLNISSPDDAQILGEILSNFSSVNLDPLFVQQQQKQARARDMKSSILFNNLNSPTSNYYTPCQQTTLATCHLVELAYDVQTTAFEQSTTNSSEYIPTSNSILSVSIAADIKRQIQTADANFEKIDDLLHSFEQVSSHALHIVQQWLIYSNDKLKMLAYHAALLLAYSNIWTVLGMNILCDLLLNKTDRFRQRAEFIMKTSSLPWRSSQLGSDVFLVLIERNFFFRTTSPYASLITTWAFGKLTIDDTDHLIKLMAREKCRLQAILENTTGTNKNDQKPSSYTTLINGVSAPVLSYLIQTIEDETNNIMKMKMESSPSEVQIQFVENLLQATGCYTRLTVGQEKNFLDMCVRILNNDMINVRIRHAVAFALGYCSKNGLSLLQAEILKPVSLELLPITLNSYCRCLSEHYDGMTDLEKTTAQSSLEPVIALLVGSASEISQAAADGLARIYALWDDGLNILLKCFHHDHIRAHVALLNATKDLYVNSVSQKCIEQAAELIEQHSSSLLPLFILELFQSIERFDASIDVREKAATGFRGIIATVGIAAVLVQKMPAAFCAEVNRSKFGEKIKRALFYASKQHDFPRRAACVAVLSVFGDLTSDMCDMFITALLDSPESQTTAFDCVSRIQRASDLNVIETLFSHMSSESLIARYTIAKLLVKLHQQGVISVNKVQQALSEAISDRSSRRNLWICTTAADISAWQQTYEYAGRLDRLLYAMLVEMSFNISKQLLNSSPADNSNHQLSLEHDFQQAAIPSCGSSFHRIGALSKLPVFADHILGSKHSIDCYYSNNHKHMLPFLYQILWWKEERALTFPLDIRDSSVKLYRLAQNNDMNAHDLVYYAMSSAGNQADEIDETNETDET